MSRMNEFREFVSIHPLLRDEVKNGKRTWQNIYEEWVLYGDDASIWKEYLSENNEEKARKKEQGVLEGVLNTDGIKNILGYVKNIKPDKVNSTLNNIQKIIQIVQTVGGSKQVSVPNVSSVFSDWWD